MTDSNYNRKLKNFSRDLRKHGTPGEAILWSEVLSRKKFYELQFNRQFPIGEYIVDFICRKLKLIIEIDGASHQHKVLQDEQRDFKLGGIGYRVLRISEKEVLNDLSNVIRALEANLPEEIWRGQAPLPLLQGGSVVVETKNLNYIK